MGHFVTVATCALNQWALDFAGNLARVTDSIRRAKAANATLRIGAELELTGYSCQDHFLEGDTVLHAWESLEHVLRVSHSAARGMLIDTGMPVVHRGACYNCRVVVLDGRILLIRPKMHLANDGNYREPRWFTAWTQPRTVEQHVLPRRIVRVMAELHPELAAQTDQRSGMSPLHTVAFGDGVVAARDAVVGVELCEELFAPQSPHIAMSLDGVDIFTNSSGSHHELRKLHRRVELMREATAKCGGAYLYANQRGCDGDRLYFDGCAMVAVNGDVVAQGSQFGLADVEVVVATFDIEDVRSYRAAVASRGVQAASSPSYPRVFADVALTEPATAARAAGRAPTQPLATVRYHTTAEEIALGPACWLWDYLRRAKLGGFFLPDEAEMGMSYAELAEFGRLRKVHRCGPYSMFAKLLDRWQPSVDHGGRGLSPAEIAAKVKRFFFFHAINRHKMTTLTPSYHAEAYSPDDNRFDLRPFLYDASWQRQFEDIDADVAAMASAAASNCSSTSPSSAS
ncbi:carbon-nitrogen hydrolase [Ramicandelaber brevisporus]|nr:carbon-nitrogen hydrolase [Ramicandelaber brevisporus]